MEKFVAVFAVLAALLAANVSVSEAQTENKYFKVGGDLHLSPQKVSGSIFSIVWKYDKNLLAEWVKDSIELTYYSKFRGRSELDTVTGELVVRNMTSDHKGLYSVEINNQVQSRVYQTVEIQEVPEPTVELQPLVCGSATESCGLKCHGDFGKAEPVSYFWKKDDGGWEPSGDRKELSDEERNNVKTFTCRMKNPVSEKDSEPFKNPFYQEKKENEESSSTGKIVGGVIGGLVVLLGIVGVICKRKPIMKKISSLRGNGGPSNPESTPSDDKAKNQLLDKTGTSESPTGDKDENELHEVKYDPNHKDKSASPGSVEPSAGNA